MYRNTTTLLFLAGVLFVFVLLVFACGDDAKGGDGDASDGDGGDGGQENDGTGGDPAAGFPADFKTSGEFFTRMAGMVAGQSPHGVVQIWYASSIQDIIDQDTFTVPEGTMVIKEFNIGGDDTIDGYAIMTKMGSDFDPDHGNWRYEERDPNGALTAEPITGPPDECWQCHTTNTATDYLKGTRMR